MPNKVVVTRENGEDIVIDILLSFEVEELHKRYIAYTLNDDGVSENVVIMISEIDDNNHIVDVYEEDKDLVFEAYNAAKELIMEEE